MGHEPNTNNLAMGPDAPIPTNTYPADEKIRFDDDHNETMDGDAEFVKRNPSAINPLDALGLDNVREIEKKVVRRLDLTLLPMLWVLYLSNYLDRTNIAYVPKAAAATILS